MSAGLTARPECIPCSLRQALSAARRVSADEWVHAKVLKRVMAEMVHVDLARSPAEVTFEALRIASKLLGGRDAFAEDKRQHNDLVKALLPDLRKRVAESSDSISLATRLAIAGNIMDLGVASEVDARAEIDRAVDAELAIDDLVSFREAIRSAKSVFYLLDNAGEAVLDLLLIEQFRRKDVTCLVRSSPVLNDVTEADAIEAGLGEVATICSPGAPMLGFVPSLADPEVRDIFVKADLVIAKGQANLETLYGADREVFFFLRAKCPVVAAALGVREGDAVLMRHEPPGPGDAPA
ncbi:MAG: damage-control phosphatase ARMT1 family protein [Planctomycetota bacterium]|jgi:uncharacterized protein with ATP-grasp and redox domains